MKVLALSLLRLGDLILQKPLLEGLREKHPGCEVHLMMNKQFASVEFLFKGIVDRFVYFDRELLQKSCGEKEFSIFWGYKQLRSLIEEVNATSYEAVYNLTHNRLTAHLTGLIDAEFYHGIYSQGGEFFGLSNPWIRFFNSYFGRAEATGFHYTELLASALEIPLKRDQAQSTSTKVSSILIQPLTSDAKKNWSLKKYVELAEALEAETKRPVFVLGAPFERAILESQVPAKFLRICSLAEADELLTSAALVITGDTSIKHLAALHEIPILELSLGSSQPLQVGAYTDHSLILQSRVACGPCPHSKPCSQSTHTCGEELKTSAVFEAAKLLLKSESADWQQYSLKHPELRVFKTEIRPVIGWSVECLSVGDKSKFDEVLQHKTMMVDDLNRRHQASKGVPHEQNRATGSDKRTRKVPERGPEAT